MYAHVVTKLSLAEWGRRMGIHPLHFAGVSHPGGLGRGDAVTGLY